MQLMDLVKAEGVIESLSHEKVDINLSYKMMKFLKAAGDDVNFYKSKVSEIIEKYAVRDEENNIISDGINVQFDTNKQEELDKEIRELNTKEIEVPQIHFTLTELQGLKLSAVDMMNLEQFIIQEG